MDIKHLSGDARFLFFTMMQSAIVLKKMGKDGIDYLNFAKGIWESLEMNDPDELQKIISEEMLNDIKKAKGEH